MSIFEYDKEKEEKKLRKAEYEAGWKDGQSDGINRGLSKGIIIMGKKVGLSDKEIVRQLQESLHCDEVEAMQHLEIMK